MKITKYDNLSKDCDCVHDDKVWVIKIHNQYYYQPNQGQLVCGDYLHAAHKYKTPKKALKEFTKILNYVDGGDSVLYDVVEVCHRNVYYILN
jgi:hypothetical protein